MGQDLRSWLAELGPELLRVGREVPVDYIGALTGQSPGPILFERLQGYPGWRMCDLFWKDRRWQGRVLGVEREEVVRRVAGFLDLAPMPCVEVASGPVKEQRWIGGEADLRRLPVPVQTDRDPGPYITAVNVLRDPENGVQNAAVVRTLVGGPREGVSSYVTRDSLALAEKYRRRGERMPQALVVGLHPLCELAVNYSGTHARHGEFELAGAMMGEPLELVRCETVDLWVPAQAEVVIEGFIDPNRLEADGPSPSPNLTFLPLMQRQPHFEVTAITARCGPIYRNFHATPYTDHQPLPRLFHEAILYRRLREQGIGVREVFFPPWGATLSCILQVAPSYEGQVNDALMLVMAAPWPHTKMVVAVDDDVDPHDAADVYLAMANRVDPARDVFVVPNARGHPMDPSARPIPESGTLRRVVGKWGIDATKPPMYRSERREYDRAWPQHWGEVRLADFVGASGQPGAQAAGRDHGPGGREEEGGGLDHANVSL